MAKQPSKTSGNTLLNIINLTRGRIDFRKPVTPEPAVKTYGTAQLISPQLRSKLLGAAARPETNIHQGRASPMASVMQMMGGSYSKVGQDRLENRRILELMPEVRKATRLMIASIFSPSDLSRKEIGIQFDVEGLSEDIQTKLGTAATKFFQSKLNLKTAAPHWVYQFGYETGSAVFAVVPLQSFEKIHDNAYIANEAFIQNIVDPLCYDNMFGFGDSKEFISENKQDITGLESFSRRVVEDASKNNTNDIPADAINRASEQALACFIGHEKLNLTDNPAVLRVNHQADKKRKTRNNQKIHERYKTAHHRPMLELDTPAEDEKPSGNPLLMRLPPESVTVIHTPGEPSDHQGYLVLLDVTGSPVSIITKDADEQEAATNFKNRGSDLFSQIHQAYGLGTTGKSTMDQQTMSYLYSKVVSRHIEKRLGKAGYGRVEIPNLDSTMRCLFTRMLREQRTRILFLPKEVVTYMTFEHDQYGYGVSKLKGIKFALGMKMAVQVARVLATIKGSMDKRQLNFKFDENNMEQPEAMFQQLINQYIEKSSLTFSTDPGLIQSQIAQKSFTVKAEGIPGMENFSVENVPQQGSTANVDDNGMSQELNTTIINGLDVPASTMNSLNDDEYARSVTTTNLFFAMEVSIYQDVVIKVISDVLRKYGRFSEEFQKEILDILPELNKKNRKSSENSSTDDTSTETQDKDVASQLPKNCTFETLLESMKISLPKPNIAPSKAHFESLDSMTTAITNLINSLFPDELAGSDDKVRATIGLLRARIIASNIRAYLETTGMSNVDIPDGTNFSDQLGPISNLHRGLQNLTMMVNDKVKLLDAAEAAAGAVSDASAGMMGDSIPPGYA